MSYWFADSSFNSYLGGFDMRSVTTTESMFEGATEFNQDLKDWVPSSLTNMKNMFNGASNYNNYFSIYFANSVVAGIQYWGEHLPNSVDVTDMFKDSDITHNGSYRPPLWYSKFAGNNDTLRINTLNEISTPTANPPTYGSPEKGISIFGISLDHTYMRMNTLNLKISIFRE